MADGYETVLERSIAGAVGTVENSTSPATQNVGLMYALAGAIVNDLHSNGLLAADTPQPQMAAPEGKKPKQQ